MTLKYCTLPLLLMALSACSVSLDAYKQKDVQIEPIHCYFADKKYSQGAPTVIGKNKYWCHNGQWQEDMPVVSFNE